MLSIKCVVFLLFGAFFVNKIAEAKVYLKFDALDPYTGNEAKYHIADLPQELFSITAHYLWDHFVQKEAWSLMREPLGFGKENYDNYVAHMVNNEMSQNASLGCFKTSTGELVGFSILTIENCDDASSAPIFKYKKNQKPMQVLVNNIFAAIYYDVCGEYDVDKYLDSDGLVVLPAYRGLGISTKLLKARKGICKKYDIHVSSSTFSSDVSNKAAISAGFQYLDISVPWKEFISQNAELSHLMQFVEHSEFFTRRSIYFNF